MRGRAAADGPRGVSIGPFVIGPAPARDFCGSKYSGSGRRSTRLDFGAVSSASPRIDMTKALRISAFVLGGVAALAAAGMLAVALLFDAERIKSELVGTVYEKSRRTLRIDGDLELSFWPSIGVSVGRTSLSEPASDAIFVAVDRARVSLALGPLLRGKVAADQVEAEGLVANIVRFENGRFNFEAPPVGRPGAGDDANAVASADETPLRFDIAGARLNVRQLTFRDEREARNLRLSDFDFVAGRLGRAVEGPLEFAGRVAAGEPRVDLTVKFSGRYDIDLARERIALRALRVSANGRVGELSGTLISAAAEKIAFGPGVVEVDRVEGQMTGTRASEELAFRFEVPKLSLSPEHANGASARAALAIGGAGRSVEAKLELSGFEAVQGMLRADRLAFALDARRGGMALTGALHAPVSAWISEQRFELPELQGALTLAHPEIASGELKLPLAGLLAGDFRKPMLRGRLASRFDETALTARFEVTRFAPAALALDVEADRVNVDRYLSPRPSGKAGSAAGGGGAGGELVEGEKTPVDLSALRSLDMKAVVRVGALQVSNLKAADVRLAARVSGGRLTVSPASASLYQGKLAGNFSADANDGRITSRQTLSEVTIGPLMNDAFGRDAIEGRGTVAIDLATSAGTIPAMKRALSGTARISLRDGAVKGINLAKTLRELRAMAGGDRAAVQRASHTEKTDFAELTASFRVDGGVAKNDDLLARSPLLRVAGAGNVDIGEAKMDYLAKVSVVATSTGQGGKELSKLKGVTVPVRVTGPFDRLSYRVDLGDALRDVAKTKAQDALKEKLERRIGEDAAEQLLKGSMR